MGALKQFDTAKYQIDELRIGTKSTEKVVVWVEGNDWKLYGRFFNSEMVDPQGRKGGYSCHTAIESYEEFKDQFPNRLAIVIKDADFKRINGDDLESNPNIFYADCHDHEMMCIYQSRVRDALMDNFMIDNKDDTFFKRIFDELLLLSFFQWFNFNNVSSYNFDTLGNLFGVPEDFFKNPATIEAEVHKRSESARNKKGITEALAHIDLKEYAKFMNERKDANCYEITNGHDFYNRINFYLQKIDTGNKRSEDILKESIYIAFSFVFKNTQLYARLNSWCDRNKVYILKAC